MGVVLAAHGVHGHVKVRPFTESSDALLGFPQWRLRPRGGGAWRTLQKVDGDVHGETLIAQLQGVETRDAALALRGYEIGVPREDLPKARRGEIYWSDLAGMEVVNRAGQVLGSVTEVTEFGAHPLLKVAAPDGGKSAERLIPYVPAYVDGIDLEARRIAVDWQADY